MSAKIQVCYKIEYVFTYMVLSIIDDVVSLSPSNSFEILKTRKADFSEEGQSVSAGTLVSQKLTVVSDLTLVQANKLRGHLILRLTLSDGRVVVWGSLDNPVQRESLQKEMSAGKTIFTRQTTEFEI